MHCSKKKGPRKSCGIGYFFRDRDEVLSSFAGIMICNDKDPCFKEAWAGCAVLLVISYGFYHGIHRHFSPPGNKSKLEGCWKSPRNCFETVEEEQVCVFSIDFWWWFPISPWFLLFFVCALTLILSCFCPPPKKTLKKIMWFPVLPNLFILQRMVWASWNLCMLKWWNVIAFLAPKTESLGFIWATVKISEDQFSREGLKMTSDMHETL